jgi:hypothetical protein
MNSIVESIQNNIEKFNNDYTLPINKNNINDTTIIKETETTNQPIFKKKINKFKFYKQIVILFVLYFCLYIVKLNFITKNKYIIGFIKAIIFIIAYHLNYIYL